VSEKRKSTVAATGKSKRTRSVANDFALDEDRFLRGARENLDLNKTPRQESTKNLQIIWKCIGESSYRHDQKTRSKTPHNVMKERKGLRGRLTNVDRGHLAESRIQFVTCRREIKILARGKKEDRVLHKPRGKRKLKRG